MGLSSKPFKNDKIEHFSFENLKSLAPIPLQTTW
jgi:hypothetical protein